MEYRYELINYLGKKIQAKTYLEIGVKIGSTFNKVNIKEKIGVDTNPRFDSNQVIKLTSDKFFEQYINKLNDKKIDIAFVDGLHTYQQSFQDVENCLKILNPEGYVVLHDCNPIKKVHALPSLEEAQKDPNWDRKWNGDVWKTIIHLRSKRKDLKICVIDIDHGMGVIKKGSSDDVLNYKDKEIKNMKFEYLDENRDYLLNIKEFDYLEKF